MKFYKTLGLEFFPWTERLVKKLSRPDYRHEYVAEGVKTWIARQIRALRDQRNWSQGDLGERMDKPQSAISRIEDPDYGKLSLQTLLEVARAYDVGLVVKFVDYPTFLRETKAMDSGSLTVPSFDERQFSTSHKHFIRVQPSSKTTLEIPTSAGNVRVFNPLRPAPSNRVQVSEGIGLQ